MAAMSPQDLLREGGPAQGRKRLAAAEAVAALQRGPGPGRPGSGRQTSQSWDIRGNKWYLSAIKWHSNGR